MHTDDEYVFVGLLDAFIASRHADMGSSVSVYSEDICRTLIDSGLAWGKSLF